MALTSVDEVRRLGGMNEAGAYLEFRLPEEAALDALISEEIDFISSYLTSAAGSYYTQTSDVHLQARFRRGEAYLVLCELHEPLKARKVRGVHAPYDSEESLSYQRLIEEEWRPRAEFYIGEFLPIESEGAFSLGAFAITSALDRFGEETASQTEQNQDLLDEASDFARLDL